MNAADREDYVKRYEQMLVEFGESPHALGWGKHGRQDVRYRVLAEDVLQSPGSSVLDVGCGFADLYRFLTERGWRGNYTGIDLVPGLLRVARSRYPELDLRELDLAQDAATVDQYDFVIGSGIFNARLRSGDNRNHIRQMLTEMCRLARVAVCVDFLSTFVDFRQSASWHTEPGWALDTARTLTRRLRLRHDYMPFEFALVLFTDDRISSRNVFEPEPQVDE